MKTNTTPNPNNSFSAGKEFPRRSEAKAEPLYHYTAEGNLFDELKEITFLTTTENKPFTFATNLTHPADIQAEIYRYDTQLTYAYLYGLLSRHKQAIMSPTSKHIQIYNRTEELFKEWRKAKSHYTLKNIAEALLPITHNATSKRKLNNIIKRFR